MKKKDEKELEIPDQAYHAKQLTLFQYFVPGRAKEDLSNTIELWDSLPKYSVSQQAMNRLRTPDGYLPIMKKSFVHKEQQYDISISPALIEDDKGVQRAYYPSANEELIEDALRKLATEQEHGFFDSLKPQSGVTFSIRMLRNELKKRGHTRSQPEIIRSLDILSESIIEISDAEGESGFARAAYLPGLAVVSRKKWRQDTSARWVAQFHPMVTDGIDRLSYRQYNYHLMMSHSSQLTRWLHKRLAHNFVQASEKSRYHLLLTSVRRDSGLLEYKRVNDQMRKMEASLDELIKNNVLQSYRKKERRGSRNRIDDIKYTLAAHPDFIADVVLANFRNKMLDDKKHGK